jgi:hypothetical protein
VVVSKTLEELVHDFANFDFATRVKLIREQQRKAAVMARDPNDRFAY